MKKIYHHYSSERIIKPAYDISHISTGIVHIGLGAFHRAHQAFYTDQAMGLSDRTDWGIVAASLRHGHELVQNLRQQDYWYTITEKASSGARVVRLIGAIIGAMAVRDNREPLLQVMSRPSTRIITLTITEKGYYLDPASHQLNTHDPLICYDMVHPHHPKTAIGLIIEALSRRKLAGIPPFSVLSCDNIPDNGQVTRSAVLQLAQLVDSDLADWIASHACFPSCIVDRIVPAVSEQDLDEICDYLQAEDQCGVITEPFHQWVIEDNFTLGRPDWDLVEGARFVDNVLPWQIMKLTLLNGSHSLLAYLGCLAGYQTIAEAMEDPLLVQIIRHYMTREAIPTLNIPPETDVNEYVSQLLERFANPALKHRTDQVASDGSQKIPIRWLPSMIRLLESQRGFNSIALGIAAWFRYLDGLDDCQQPIIVNDPCLEALHRLKQDGDSSTRVIARLVRESDIFPDIITNSPTAIGRITDYYQQLNEQGVKKTLQNFHAAMV